MNYEERLRHRYRLERVWTLKEQLSDGEPSAPLTREEAQEMVDLLESALESLSPARFDSMMEAIAAEAARRAGNGFGPR